MKKNISTYCVTKWNIKMLLFSMIWSNPLLRDIYIYAKKCFNHTFVVYFANLAMLAYCGKGHGIYYGTIAHCIVGSHRLSPPSLFFCFHQCSTQHIFLSSEFQLSLCWLIHDLRYEVTRRGETVKGDHSVSWRCDFRKGISQDWKWRLSDPSSG